ncbi:MAG TPA: hypothetical protein VJX67_26800, partial [Blastocatellia bacterium]|nr:hypothetical protein [Blastocatellia bacterium]
MSTIPPKMPVAPGPATGSVGVDDASSQTSRDSEIPRRTGEPRSTWGRMWRKLRRNKMAMAGLYMLLVLYAGAIGAGFISPYSYETQH